METLFNEANIGNKKRAQTETSKARVQFPASLESVDSDAIIKQHNGYVKANIGNEKRAQAETSVARVQFPAALESVDSDAIIKQHNGYVKDNIPSRKFSLTVDNVSTNSVDRLRT